VYLSLLRLSKQNISEAIRKAEKLHMQNRNGVQRPNILSKLFVFHLPSTLAEYIMFKSARRKAAMPFNVRTEMLPH
jgi:hypothetical protein